LRRFLLIFLSAAVLLSATQASGQILHRKKKVNKSTEATNSAEPDRVLYDRALDDIKHGKHEVGRLGLQTLINTYPDSEFLAKAKLAIADSYFKEGGTSNTTQAIAGYKDFNVFFPFLPEAAYAQMQIAMAHYNEMPKPDRDNAHSKSAEEEFQTFLQKYPKDPLAPKAQQRLREVQEVIAEGQFRVGYFYFVKGDRRAAAGRLAPLVRRYPLYSKSDNALWMLADIFEKSERKDVAAFYYAQIVRNYPLSGRAGDAKGKLQGFGVPVPQPDPKAAAWMTAEQNAPRPRETPPHRVLGLLRSGPDVHMAATSGAPNMEPEADTTSGVDILSGGGRTALVGSGAGASTGTTGIVGTVKPGEPAPAGGTPAEDVNSSGSSDANGPAADGNTPADGNTASDTSSASTTPATTTDATQPAASDATPANAKNPKESSSKKKGIKKIIPW